MSLVGYPYCASDVGREAIDRTAMCKAVYPYLAGLGEAEREAVIAATAEGYSFPTNLDQDPPIGGMAPKTQADIMREALKSGANLEELCAELDALAKRQQP